MSSHITALPYNDYVQSANTLFHFMSKSSYLEDILLKRAIIPRYCVENLEYLNVKTEEGYFEKIAVLQKCFCDIPFHKLTDSFAIEGQGENFDDLSDTERIRLSQHNSHPDFYGKYGIAFSKKWGENHNLQPVHYINEDSEYLRKFSEAFNQALNSDDLPDLYSEDLIRRISYMKPLRGSMTRQFKLDGGKEVEVNIIKNFHDEREWRYVPKLENLEKLEMAEIIPNPNALKPDGPLWEINKGLTQEKYESIWLKFDYDEIRYIIVPDVQERLKIIKTIMSIPAEKFKDPEQTETQRYIMISKIIVLDELRKDW